MSAPRAGWSAAADDDMPPEAAPPSGGAAARGGLNTIFRERGLRGAASPARPAAPGATGALATGAATSVLADRLAAALVHHEPGWRLPRHSALARRYNVSVVEIDGAGGELIARHPIRRPAGGPLYP